MSKTSKTTGLLRESQNVLPRSASLTILQI